MRTIDIFVRDHAGHPLHDAEISFTMDGVPAGSIPSSEGRGRISLPDRDSVVEVTATYGAITDTVKLSPQQDDYTFNFEVEPMKQPIPKTSPDLIDAFIIVVIAAAIDIFAFSMATQFINNPAFQKLPSFITDAYTAMWTSVVGGAAGIGAAALKAFTRKPGQQTPNYLLYVLLTALGLLVVIVGLAFVATKLSPVQAKAPETVVTYRICSGEYERACLPHDIYQYCGFDVNAWARERCNSYKSVRLDTRGGNKCGYSIDQVICTGPK
jgi:F0F1-type ATP synthase membrane subunit c/vacuolar-type H+-ATPase subunit K